MRHNSRDDGQLSCRKREMNKMNANTALDGHTTVIKMAERGGVPLKIWVLGVVPSRCRLNTAVCGRSKSFFLVTEHFQASWLSFFRVG